MKKSIIIDITEEGEIKIDTRGYSGKACVQESQFLKDLLGTELSRQLTPAYYQTEHSRTVVKKHLPLCG
jgi:hypothetical protein